MTELLPEAINIGLREQRKRRLLGIVALTIGVAAAFLLVVYNAPRWSRVVVFLPIWIAGLGLMQAREKYASRSPRAAHATWIGARSR
jgi:hypothetical protein